MEIQTRVKKWGNSFGIVIPIEEIKEKNLKEGEEVFVEIRKKKKLKEIFGILRDKPIDAQKAKDELRREWNK